MARRKIFVNLTAHRLLEDQILAVREMGMEIVEAEEVVPPSLLQKLRQCPADPQELVDMAYALSDCLVRYAQEHDAVLYVHLPVGSPAFMWIFADVFPHTYCGAVFSHTRREVREVLQPDGSVIKKSVFKFEKFIVL